MRGSVRVRSLLGFAVFGGWSLLVTARERLGARHQFGASTSGPVHRLRREAQPPPRASPALPSAIDPKLLN